MSLPTIPPSISSIGGLGTGIATALAVNVGTDGAPVIKGGALGTPSSGVATNLTGTAAGLTAGAASAVAVGGITGLGSGVATFLATPSGANLATALTTALPATKGGTGLTALGTGIATALGVNVGSDGAPVVKAGALGTPSSGVATNLTGTAAGLTAGTVTTNANLTGDVTSSGNATTIASNAVTTAKIADANVTLAKIVNAAFNSTLLGSGAAGAGSAYVPITLGTNLSMSGTTLNATGGGSSGWEYKGSGFTAVAGGNYVIENPGSTPTVTMPAGVVGEEVVWVWARGTSAFLDGNGNSISQGSFGAAEGGLCSIIYHAGPGWIVTEYLVKGAAIDLANSSTATTQTPVDNSTKVATTAYVDAAIAAYLSGPGTLAAILSAAGITPTADAATTPVTSIDTVSGIVTAKS